jgi:hypothetical protein
LLSSGDSTSLGLGSAGKARTVVNRPVCTWQGEAEFSILIGVDKVGIGKLPGTPVDLPKHKAVQTTDTGGFQGCVVAIEVSSSSSVLVSAVLSGGRPAAEACPRSVEVAKIVDSTLP